MEPEFEENGLRATARRSDSEGGKTNFAAADRLAFEIRSAARLLPAQGPIQVFVHHNTLHAYEDRPFLEAVVEAGDILGCEPFLSEASYRQELGHGRILEEDLRVALAEDGGGMSSRIAELCTREELRLAMLEHPFQEEDGPALAFLRQRSRPLEKLLSEAPPSARWALTAFGHAQTGIESDAQALVAALHALWSSCRAAVARSGEPPAPLPKSRLIPRRRDDLLALGGPDVDELIRPLLTRWCAAFLDQSIALWQMPGRGEGLYRALRSLYSRGGLLGPAWSRGLAAEFRRQTERGRNAEEAILETLEELGVAPPDREAYLRAELLALRGWAGMIRQLEERPDRLGNSGIPVSLTDYLALRLTLSRQALARSLPRGISLRELPAAGAAARARNADRGPSLDAVTFRLFQACERLGLTPPQVDRLGGEDARSLVHEVLAFDELSRRRVFHLAYERRHAELTLAGIAANAKVAGPEPSAPSFQAIFCVDEREESVRRHLEERMPDAETLGTLGYFGVAMYFQAAGAAHAVALCPVSIRPEHTVHEVVEPEFADEDASHAVRRRHLARVAGGLRTGSKTLFRGTLLTATLGLLTTFPLVLRIFAPRLAARLKRGMGTVLRPPGQTHLSLEATGEPGGIEGTRVGFTVEEMAGIVRDQLERIGLAGRLAPVVLVVGHGSSSLNNPQESAHDCGACGGSRGGPNARAFAAMANDPRVRETLRRLGFEIPGATLFVGAYHDTCNDRLVVYDLPAARRSQTVRRAIGGLKAALQANAQERCRRFPNTSLTMSPLEAHRHVEGRAQDLAQPRPEYGHAANAVCVVGRRALTRGLFMDRRAFLASYDPDRDDARGSILERVLRDVVPVGAGINLEYYFSFVDPERYGCGTKLPHNITAMLGVMNGPSSDLRTGLPWQMVEIHEPVRLLCVIEAAPTLLAEVMARNPSLARLAENGWIRVRTLADAEEAGELPSAPSSSAWFLGHRGALAYARITGPAGLPREVGT